MINIHHLYRFILVTALFIGAVAMVGFISSTNETVYWYKNGAKDVWHMQPDVYAFTTLDGKAYAGDVDSSLVDSIYFRRAYPDKLQLVYFNESSNEWQRNQVIKSIESNANFMRSSPVVTRFFSADYPEGLWYVADNQILVTFASGIPAQPTLDDFAFDYDLTQINDPSTLPAGGIYAYVFNWEFDETYENTLNLCRKIYEADSSMFLNVEPSLIKVYQENTLPDDNVSAEVLEISDTEAINYFVFIENSITLNAYFDFKNQQSPYTFRVVDLFGRDYITETIEPGHTFLQLDISELATGIYVSCIVDENGQIKSSQKFRKVR